MARCKECGREINEKDKRCNYCNSRILPITAKKILNQTQTAAKSVASKTAESSVSLFHKTNDGVKQFREKQDIRKIEKKEQKISKLQKQIDKKKNKQEKELPH